MAGHDPQTGGAPAHAPDPCRACEVRLKAVCGVLSPGDLAALRRLATTVRLDRGATLFSTGDTANDVFNITRGALKLYRPAADGAAPIAGFFFAGDFLGFTDGDTQRFSAEALADSELCRFPRRLFHDFAERHPALEQRLLTLAAHELTAAREQMTLISHASAEARVAAALLALAARLPAAEGETCVLPMGRGDLAEYLGLTKETVSRVFSRLRAKGLIEARGARLRLLDREGLGSLAMA
jgi:CRP/FNR family transcriptional regulator